VKPAANGIRFSDHYRTVPEIKILDMLLLAGWAHELDHARARATTRTALDCWTDIGLGVRAGENGERLFDPVEVVNFLKQLGLDGRDSFWADRYVHTGRRLVADFAATGARSFDVDFRRVFVLTPAHIGKPLRLRAPLPLAIVHGDTLPVEPFVEGASGAQLNISNGRLEARLITRERCTVTLGAKLRFSHPILSPVVARPPKDSPYLKPREGLIVLTDRVSALAHSLAGPDADSRAIVGAFWAYMMDELRCGAVHYDQIRADAPCDWILDTGWYDCQLGAALFVALCRARDIPARIVGGHVLYRRAPTNHYWAEVWLEESGWTPFDFLSWDLSLGGRDPAWRHKFFGLVDHRMITQVLPREFTGAPGVPIPHAWHVLQTATQKGVEICLAAVTGETIYSDLVAIA